MGGVLVTGGWGRSVAGTINKNSLAGGTLGVWEGGARGWGADLAQHGPARPAGWQSAASSISSLLTCRVVNISSLSPPCRPQAPDSLGRAAPDHQAAVPSCTSPPKMFLLYLFTADHRHLIPLVELSLAIMRLSCERFFSLLAVSSCCDTAFMSLAVCAHCRAPVLRALLFPAGGQCLLPWFQHCLAFVWCVTRCTSSCTHHAPVLQMCLHGPGVSCIV